MKHFSLIFFLSSLLFQNINSQFYTLVPSESQVIISPIIKAPQKEKMVQLEKMEPKEKPAQKIGGEIESSDSIFFAENNLLKKRQYVSLPIDSMIITSRYGIRTDPFTGKRASHKGIDLKGRNDYIYSIMPGKVTKTGRSKSLGKFIEIKHGDFISIYGHLNNILINEKQTVDAGQPIGVSGNTGRSTGEHLHFTLKFKNKVVDPIPVLRNIEDIITTAKEELSTQLLEKTF